MQQKFLTTTAEQHSSVLLLRKTHIREEVFKKVKVNKENYELKETEILETWNYYLILYL